MYLQYEAFKDERLGQAMEAWESRPQPRKSNTVMWSALMTSVVKWGQMPKFRDAKPTGAKVASINRSQPSRWSCCNPGAESASVVTFLQPISESLSREEACNLTFSNPCTTITKIIHTIIIIIEMTNTVIKMGKNAYITIVENESFQLGTAASIAENVAHQVCQGFTLREVHNL